MLYSYIKKRERGKKMWGLPDSAVYGTYKRVKGAGGARRRKRSGTYRFIAEAQKEQAKRQRKSK